MTSANARTVANVVLISAGVAAAYVVITTPPLRRLALRGLHVWLGASIPGVPDQPGPAGVGESARPDTSGQPARPS